MKKYLMTGIAALALCVGFTSCSHDLETLSQEEIDQLEAQKVVEKYNRAFIATFGEPAANQNWGFGSTRTRTENANANEWADPDKVTNSRWKTLKTKTRAYIFPKKLTRPKPISKL